MDDSTIIRMLHARDEAALHAIRETYGGLCQQLCMRLLGSRDDADECMNDLLMEVWRCIPPQNPKSLRAFLITVTRRIAIDRLRAENRLKRGGPQLAAALDELAEVLPAPDCVEENADANALTAAVNAFLRGITPAARQLFMQRYFLALPVKEIAAQHGMTQGAVKASLHRTREGLRVYLQKEGFL